METGQFTEADHHSTLNLSSSHSTDFSGLSSPTFLPSEQSTLLNSEVVYFYDVNPDFFQKQHHMGRAIALY